MNIRKFMNEKFGEIRAVEIEGHSWFIGKDVVEALGYDLKTHSYIKYINKYADYVFITTSDKGDILTPFIELEKKVTKDKETAHFYLDRKEAIQKAIDIENDDDKINVIFISGRGNRSVMCLENGEISSFNDIDEVKNIIGDK